MKNKAMIEIKGLTKAYGLVPVLRGVDLHIAESSFMTLVGPNGAGKTTLMRILATLLKQSSGEVLIGGWPLPTHASRIRGHIGMLSHQPMAYGDLSPVENLQFFADLYGVENREERVEEMLRFVGLYRRKDDFVRTFSRGMLQRLAIARATIHNPDVLLLDEPYTGLDQEAVILLDELLQQQRQLGRTILMITHDFVHGLNLCDQISILNRGKIAALVNRSETTPGQFLEMYREIIKR
ncbi:MAG: ABC transporter ATP-binding protein [Chloroflexota bacterium]